jgi:hypothetical protein
MGIKYLLSFIFIFIFYFSAVSEVRGQSCSGAKDAGTRYMCAFNAGIYTCPGGPVLNTCYLSGVSCVYDHVVNSHCIIDGNICQGSGSDCTGSTCSDTYATSQYDCFEPTSGPSSPTPTGTLTPTPIIDNNVRGSHDDYSGTQFLPQCRAIGWATDPDVPASAVEVRFNVDGTGWITGPWASLYRAGLESECPSRNGFCAFDIDLSSLVTLDDTHEIWVQAKDVNTGQFVNIANTRKSIICQDLPPQSTCTVSAAPLSTTEGTATSVAVSGYSAGSGATNPDVRVVAVRQDGAAIPDYNNSSVISPQSPLTVQQVQDPGTGYYFYDIRSAGCTPPSGSDNCSSTTNVYLPEGDYYLYCDVPDDPGKCSGNPFCDYEDLATSPIINCTPSGWVSCSDNDNLEYVVLPPPASCSITAYDVELTGIGDITLVPPVTIPSGTEIGGNIIEMFFATTNPSVASFIDNPPSYPNPDDNGAPWWAQIQANAIDDTTYTVIATMDDAASTTCVDSANVTVNPPDPWCQIGKGDAIVGHVDEGPLASITVPIPILDPITYLMTGTPLPGIPIAGGSVSASPGLISTTGWRVQNSPYAGNLPSYTAFRNKIPDTVPQSVGGALGQADLTNLGNQFPAGSGYFYIEYDGSAGPLTIQEAGGINLGTRKVIVFADSAVNINDKINLTKGVGFFMLIASGNITINQSVGGSNDNVPEIEGVYYTDRNFYTGTEGLGLDNQLHIRGVVVAGNTTGHGVVLDRSTAYTEVPGEIFEFGPDQSMLIPPALSKREIRWREVLP